MDSSYRPTRLRAQLVIGLVGLHGVLTVVSLAGQAWTRHVIAVGDSLDGPVTHAIDQLQAFGEQASVVVEIGCAIAFLVWLYRAFANLPALGSTRERIAP